MSATLAWPPREISARCFDRDGRMHVSTARVTKCGISPYYGREIPRAQQLGLDPNKIYNLFRPPSELIRAIPTLNCIPILARHSPVDASRPQASLIIGCTASDAKWQAPYATVSVTIFDGGAIAGIESDLVREISSGYHYTANMMPIEFNGQRADGSMVSLSFNHLAIVPNGRVGSDCIVPD